MSREWKLGDVAVRKSAAHLEGGYESLAVATTCYEQAHQGQGLHWHNVGGGWDPLHVIDGPTYRPLVVIDPEDTEAVERLWRTWATLAPDHRLAQDNLQDALREFANPKPPKPEEPTGLGAVVEDEDGTKWLRHDSVAIHRRWLNTDDCDTRYRAWDELAVVRVLSEGVQP